MSRSLGRRSRGLRVLALSGFATFGACATAHVPLLPSYQRPNAIAREWVDVRKTSATDTALWVLRDDGYDGSAHIRVATDEAGSARVTRTESRYGGWYFSGTLGDTAHQAICFSKRLGRFGATCDAFSMDTVAGPNGPTLRLTVRGYRGEHSVTERVLLARQ